MPDNPTRRGQHSVFVLPGPRSMEDLFGPNAVDGRGGRGIQSVESLRRKIPEPIRQPQMDVYGSPGAWGGIAPGGAGSVRFLKYLKNLFTKKPPPPPPPRGGTPPSRGVRGTPSETRARQEAEHAWKLMQDAGGRGAGRGDNLARSTLTEQELFQEGASMAHQFPWTSTKNVPRRNAPGSSDPRILPRNWSNKLSEHANQAIDHAGRKSVFRLRNRTPDTPPMVRTPPGANPIQAGGGIPKNLEPAINEIMRKGDLEGSVAAYKAAPLFMGRPLVSATRSPLAGRPRMENSNAPIVTVAWVAGSAAIVATSLSAPNHKEASRVTRTKESQIWDLRKKGLEIGAWMSGASSSPPVFLGR